MRCAIWFYRHRRNCFHVADDKSPSAHPWIRYVAMVSYDVHVADIVQRTTYTLKTPYNIQRTRGRHRAAYNVHLAGNIHRTPSPSDRKGSMLSAVHRSRPKRKEQRTALTVELAASLMPSAPVAVRFIPSHGAALPCGAAMVFTTSRRTTASVEVPLVPYSCIDGTAVAAHCLRPCQLTIGGVWPPRLSRARKTPSGVS